MPMERVIELTQRWEGNDPGAQPMVSQDMFDLLIKNEMGKPIDQGEEIKRFVALANEQAEANVEAAETAELDNDGVKIKEAVEEILTAQRKGEVHPNMQSKIVTDDMGHNLAPKSADIGWKSTAHFWHAAAKACQKHQAVVDPMLTNEHIAKAAGYHEVGDDTLGGYLVPDDVRQELMKERLENSVVRGNGARVIPTVRDNIVLARIDDASHATSVFGNVVFFWINEQAALTERNLVFGQLQIPIEKLAGLTYITRELLGDAFVSVEAEVRQSFSEGAAWFEDDAFLNGTGAGMPMGITNSGANIGVARAGALTVTYPDIANMYARQRYPGRAVWVANQSILPQLLQMTGGTEVIWIGLSQGATQTPPGSLLGRPIIFTEKLPALGTADDLMFLDISHYIIGDRENIRIDRSDDVQFLTDQIALRFILRVGGRSRTDVAFTPNNGNTLSPYVGLNA